MGFLGVNKRWSYKHMLENRLSEELGLFCTGYFGLLAGGLDCGALAGGIFGLVVLIKDFWLERWSADTTLT